MTELNKTTDLNSHIAQSANAASRILASEVQSLTEIAEAIEKSIARSESTGLEPPPTLAEIESVPAGSVILFNLPSPPPMTTTREAENVADKIVEMAKKQASERKNKQSS